MTSAIICNALYDILINGHDGLGGGVGDGDLEVEFVIRDWAGKPPQSHNWAKAEMLKAES